MFLYFSCFLSISDILLFTYFLSIRFISDSDLCTYISFASHLIQSYVMFMCSCSYTFHVSYQYQISCYLCISCLSSLYQIQIYVHTYPLQVILFISPVGVHIRQIGTYSTRGYTVQYRSMLSKLVLIDVLYI